MASHAGHAPKRSGNPSARVSAKIGKLMHEGKSPKQAQAMALNMERAHRLTAGGGYKRVGGKKR